MTMPFRLSAVAGLIFLGAMANAGAETTTDRYGKELKIEPTRNIFARFGVLGFKLNNKSEAARDVSGAVLAPPAVARTNPLLPPVITPGDRSWTCNRGLPIDPDDPDLGFLPPCSPAADPVDRYGTIYGSSNQEVLFGDPDVPGSPASQGIDTLGLPPDVRAHITNPAPGAVATVGMYFDEAHKWAVEVPVMALPFKVDIYGRGTFQNAGKIITGKTLGFFVFGHYYFGQKADKFRPSVSLTANYLIPFDLQATSSLENWAGGKTKISSKGSIGLGWLIGGKYAINDRWDVNLHMGQFKAKVENTLVTRDTVFTDQSIVFQNWPGALGERLRALAAGGSSNLLKTQLQELILYRNYDPSHRVNGGANLGTFTRKQTQTLDPYVVMMTVGYNF
ncbi:MAG: hypothetical protein C0487_13730 [Leptothrix sp. (in: Bacteria)]|nr:hypothetical protein [Leptothrix sp. (in: b-proteobacteria)]